MRECRDFFKGTPGRLSVCTLLASRIGVLPGFQGLTAKIHGLFRCSVFGFRFLQPAYLMFRLSLMQ